MSDFKFFCPECGQKIAYDESYSGLQVTCPTCQKLIVTPASLAPAARRGSTITDLTGSSAPNPHRAPEKSPAHPQGVRRASAITTDSVSNSNLTRAIALGYPCLAFASLVATVWFAFKSIPVIVLAWAIFALVPMFFLRIGEIRSHRVTAVVVKISCVALGLLILLIVAKPVTKHYLAPKIVVRESNAELDALKPRIVDEVLTGITESEKDHQLGGEHLLTGPFNGKFWRSAIASGSISYVMKVLPDRAMSLNCRYWGGEQAGRTFDICIDGKIIATQNLEFNVPGHFFDVEYKIPRGLTRGKTEVTVKFQAHPGLAAGGLFGCQTLKR